MIKNIKIIRELKRLKKKPVNQIFLNSLKMRLEVFVDNCPIKNDTRRPVHHTLGSILRMRVTQVSFAVFMITILLGSSVATASQSSLPGERLYPIKIFTEEVRSATTLNTKDKADLRMSFATKRIEEIKKILEETEIEPADLEIAFDQFEKNLTKATGIIQKEKPLADNINTKTEELHQDITKSKDALEKTMRDKKTQTEDKEKEISEKIKKIIEEDVDNKEGKETLIDKLIEIKINREILEAKEKDVYKILENKRDNEEISEGKDDNDDREKAIKSELKYDKRVTENKREVIRSREEAKKDIREKVIREIKEDEDEREKQKEEDRERDKGDREGDNKDD